MFTEAEYAAAAARLGVPVAAVKAVAEVESGGDGFLPDGRPKILFEAHHFGARTGHQYDAAHPDISAPNWEEARKHYIGGAAEYGRQAKAAALNEKAALESASYGYFQVMGLNWKDLSYSSVREFVDANQTAAGQLDAFMRYIKRHGLDVHMRSFPDEDACRAFAAGYNGTGAVDVYGPKIAEAFARYSGGPRTALRKGDRGEDVRALQAALGIKPDGDFGPMTEEAVRLFQADQGLTADGIAGPKTMHALTT